MRLTAHPETPSHAIQRIEVEALRREGSELSLTYRAFGNLDRIRVPDPATAIAGRTDELWRSTCFEAFVQAVGQPDYVEFNFGLANQWASYRFDGERTGMRQAGIEPYAIRQSLARDRLELVVDIQLGRLGRSDLPALPWRMGLSTVVEDVDGGISYWALAHPSAKPDFHHPDSFVLILPPPEPA